MMVGDGINDSCLSEADVGIAISGGAALAREIADITIAADTLWELVELRRIAAELMRRIHSNYRFVIGFNGALIALGVTGILSPAASAMLHNLSTLGVSLRSMGPLPQEKMQRPSGGEWLYLVPKANNGKTAWNDQFPAVFFDKNTEGFPELHLPAGRGDRRGALYAFR